MTIYVVFEQFPNPGHDIASFRAVEDARAFVQTEGRLVFPLILVRTV
jgi:hypothetical protein